MKRQFKELWCRKRRTLAFFSLTITAVHASPHTLEVLEHGKPSDAKALPQKSHSQVSKRNGVLAIKLPGGKKRRYTDNLRVFGGTFVKYSYKGYLRSINAHAILMEKMNPELMFLSERTGKEINVGRLYSISPNGTRILSSDCVESSFCFYQVTKWPSGENEFIRETQRGDGISGEDSSLESPILWKTVFWKSNDEVAFTVNCASASTASGYQFNDVVLKYKAGKWNYAGSSMRRNCK